jgi:hypothetical protein
VALVIGRVARRLLATDTALSLDPETRNAHYSEKMSPGLDPGAPPFLRRRCLSAVGDPLLDPGFHFFHHPRHSAGPKPYPLGELAGGLKSRDMCEAVGDTENRFEFLLRYELPCHCISLVKGTLQRPESPGHRKA